MRGYIGFLSFEWHKNTPCFCLSKEFFQLLNREELTILTHNLQRKKKKSTLESQIMTIPMLFELRIFVYRKNCSPLILCIGFFIP